MFKQDADYPFVDWSFAGTTEEEFATLMAIFNAEDQKSILPTMNTSAFMPYYCAGYVGHLSGRRSVAGEQQHGCASA
ncbi:MAG: hypothetical protein ACLTXH_02555 [Enterobacter hormaechei]